MTEMITVYRGEQTTGPYGETLTADPVEWATLDALVAPSHPAEPVEAGRAALITGYTIYIRGTGPTGILDTDLIEVRGERLPVNGKVAAWYSASGVYRGDQLAVKAVSG